MRATRKSAQANLKLINELHAEMSVAQNKTRHVRTIIMKAHDDIVQISRSLPDHLVVSLALLQVAKVLNEGEQMVKNQESDLAAVRVKIDKIEKKIEASN